MNTLPGFINRFLRTRDVVGPESALLSLNHRSAMLPNAFYVDGQNGRDGNDGRDPRTPKQTVAAALAVMGAGDTLYLVGNITEEVIVRPELEDISIIGVSNRPRHADHARDTTFSTNQGCSWRSPSTAAAPLITLRAQGVRVENILFAVPTSFGAILLSRNALSGTSEFDASHAAIVGCRFAGGQDGIRDSGGCFNVLVENCVFQAQTGNGILTVDTAVAVPLMWEVKGCYFVDNDNHMRVSFNKAIIHNNIFGPIGSGVGVTLNFVAAQGAGNIVTKNYLSGDYDGEYLGGTGDEWAGNFSMDTGSAEVGAEAITTAAPVA